MASLEYRYLGESTTKVSALGLGCREFGKKGLSPEVCKGVARRALDLGVNFFDTADIYGDGQSEEFLGLALARIPRDSYVLATKGGTERLGPGMERQNGQPAYLRKSLDASLKRLRVDYVDLYQLHNPDPAVPLDYAAEEMLRFVEEGKVRHIGVSNMDKQDLDRWLTLVPDTVSVQLSYSLLDRGKVQEIFSRGHGLRLSLIPWAPLFMGFLTNPPPLEPERRSGVASMLTQGFVEATHKVCALVREIAADHWTTPSAVALAYVLRCPEAASIPVGTTSPAHVQENLRALELSLSPGEMDQLANRAASVPEPDISATIEVSEALDGGRVAVLPFGLKVRVPGKVARGDMIEINMWDGRVKSSPGHEPGESA